MGGRAVSPAVPERAQAPERSQTAHVPPPAVLLTAAGKRYDIVSCFARLTRTIVTDPAALAPAQYAAHVRVAVPVIEDPGYVPALEALCEEHGVGVVLPLTDLDIEILARARARTLAGGRASDVRQVRGTPAAAAPGTAIACDGARGRGPRGAALSRD